MQPKNSTRPLCVRRKAVLAHHARAPRPPARPSPPPRPAPRSTRGGKPSLPTSRHATILSTETNNALPARTLPPKSTELIWPIAQGTATGTTRLPAVKPDSFVHRAAPDNPYARLGRRTTTPFNLHGPPLPNWRRQPTRPPHPKPLASPGNNLSRTPREHAAQARNNSDAQPPARAA